MQGFQPLYSLELYCNVVCVSLFYRYYNGFYSIEITHHLTLIFLGEYIRLWANNQWIAYCITDKMSFCVTHFLQKSFLSLMLYKVSTLASTKTIPFFLLPLTYFPSSNTMHSMRMGQISSALNRQILEKTRQNGQGVHRNLKKIIRKNK